MAKTSAPIADDLGSVSWTARTLEIAERTVREWADKGVLPAVRLPNGSRIFQRSVIERMAAERAKTRAGR